MCFYYSKFYTATPPLIIGLFLTNYSADTRLKSPQLYTQTKNIFNYKVFWVWIIVAVFHSMFIFWICILFMKQEVVWTQGIVGDYSLFGNVLYTVINIFMNCTGYCVDEVLLILLFLEFVGYCMF